MNPFHPSERFDLVVTRHKALVEYLKMCGVIDDDTPVLEHATVDDVKGKIVIGVLPMHLACHCHYFTELPLNIPQELRGRELSLEEVELYAGEPASYAVTKL
jgi:putative CRISPR-associated protein (TIGR02620 family)